MKSMRYFIIDNALFWKDNGAILLKCLLKAEADKIMQEFHARNCGGHLYWKTTTDKIRGLVFTGPLFLQMLRNM